MNDIGLKPLSNDLKLEEENWHLFTYSNYSIKMYTCKGISKNHFATLQ